MSKGLNTNQHTRNSNIELLRLVLMFMIVCHHVLLHGCGLWKTGNGAVNLTVNSFVIVAVNAFVFISGWYGMRFKMKSLVSFYVQAVFYSVVSFLLLTNFRIADSGVSFVLSFFPITTTVWWFLTAYVALYLLSPVLNKGIEALSRRQLLVVVAGLLTFSVANWVLILLKMNERAFLTGFGNSFFGFLTIYVLARYWRLYGRIPRKAWLGYVGLSVVLAAGAMLLWRSGREALLAGWFGYSNPLILGSAIGLFFAFLRWRVRPFPVVNSAAGLVFGIYLAHDNGFVRKLLTFYIECLQTQSASDYRFYACLLALAVGVFVAGMAIESLRQWAFNPIIKRLNFTN